MSPALSPTPRCPCAHPRHPSVPIPDPLVSLWDTCPHVLLFPQALDKISAYMRSGRFMKTPIFWRTAKWCNTKE